MFIPEELYTQILQVMPIPCVDLLVVDGFGNVLLLLRKDEPAAGQWWFPGGRVLFGESRKEAAKRKLMDECGLVATQFDEIGTYDLFFDIAYGVRLHSVTTVFMAKVARESKIQLDSQSEDARWLPPNKWIDFKLSPFICDVFSSVNFSLFHGR